jgi:hypothetical protein
MPFIGDNFILQHDNARPHSVRIVSEYLNEVGIASKQWPARSQDLNPIANVWDMMRRRVRALQTPPAMLGELGELFRTIRTKQMSCPLLTAWVDGVKPSIMLEVEIYPTEPFSPVYFVEAVMTIFLFFFL